MKLNVKDINKIPNSKENSKRGNYTMHAVTMHESSLQNSDTGDKFQLSFDESYA